MFYKLPKYPPFREERPGEIDYDMFFAAGIYDRFVLLIRDFDINQHKITSIIIPEFFKPHVQYVLFRSKTTMSTFPSHLDELLPNLKFIGIVDSGLEKITKEDLKNFPNLKWLTLRMNKLKYLPSDLFNYTPNIIYVNFSNNLIDKIGENIFDKCEFLREADFTNNKTIDIYFKFEEKKLEELKMIFKTDCKLMKSLKYLAEEAVIENLEEQNDDEILMIAKSCGFEKLEKELERAQEISTSIGKIKCKSGSKVKNFFKFVGKSFVTIVATCILTFVCY
ncbi:hypothetical protein PVAND_016406 [Polypedilum vanderplanki]|uniref:Uncharacterized protein n=1 Tax=Polypedilum vanderplanki TaxID=319348 RepID=A0A9J6BFH9_POLVA|nr:hypothetical protein PVAND_016406 [Polypedilum vanderplanki]